MSKDAKYPKGVSETQTGDRTFIVIPKILESDGLPDIMDLYCIEASEDLDFNESFNINEHRHFVIAITPDSFSENGNYNVNFDDTMYTEEEVTRYADDIVTDTVKRAVEAAEAEEKA